MINMAGNKIIALDIGGTHLRTGVVQNGKILVYNKIKTPKSKKQILKLLTKSVSELMDNRVKGIGIAAPGPLENGIIKNPPNMPFKNFNIQKYFEKKFHKKVILEKDSNCHALSELKYGFKKKNFILLTVGTGIGGGIVINGKLYKGQGYGGEVGNMIVNNKTNFENLAASKGVKTLTKKYFHKEVSAKELFKRKDKKSKKVMNELASYLGQGIASLINIFDPEVVVLYGGIKDSGKFYLKLVTKEAQKYSCLPKKVNIKYGKLDHPGVLGASLLIK